MKDEYGLVHPNRPYFQDQQQFSDLIDEMEKVVHFAHWYYRAIVIIYPVNFMLRMGLAFNLQPRTSMTTLSIVESYTNLYHFLILFCSVITANSTFTMVLFGRELEGYSSLPKAIMSNIR